MNIKSKYSQNDTHSLLKIFRKTSKAMKNSSKFHLSEQTWLALYFRHQIVGGYDNPWGRWQVGEKVILYKQLSSYKNFRSNRQSEVTLKCQLSTPQSWGGVSCSLALAERELASESTTELLCEWHLLWETSISLALHKRLWVRHLQNFPWVASLLPLTQRRKYSSFNLKILNVLNVKIKETWGYSC